MRLYGPLEHWRVGWCGGALAGAALVASLAGWYDAGGPLAALAFLFTAGGWSAAREDDRLR